MNLRLLLCLAVLGAIGCAHTAGPLLPAADHHQHLVSPDEAAFNSEKPLPAVALPPDLARVLEDHAKHWNEKAPLGALFTDDSVVYSLDDRNWLRGREAVSEFLSTRFARPYAIAPVAYGVTGSAAYIAGYFTRGEKAFGDVHLSLRKGDDDAWRIAAETPTFPGPWTTQPQDAEQLIAKLDAAGIRRAAVLSVAYWFGNPSHPPVADEEAKTRAANDWTAEQVARYPGRLIAFCSVNPLREYAVAELERCAKSGRFRGVKLHLGNSRVDVKNPQHAALVRQFFAAANRLRMPIVAHLWTTGDYGAEDARILLDQILPAAPDVVVQIAHFAGGGPGWTDPALGVYADAIQKGDPRMKNVYFDVATVADEQSPAELKHFAERIRQVGLHRVLFGSDLSTPPLQEWLTFRSTVPLTEEEFRTIAENVAPYFLVT